jgi:hypothetical protein
MYTLTQMFQGSRPAGRLCAIILGLFLVQCLGIPSPGAADDNGYLAQLLERTHREQLAERPEWRALLHYKPLRLGHGVASQVDEASFFLSPLGKTHPQDELDATVAGFFDTSGSDPDNSPQCRYVARYQWLKQMLAFDRERLPELSCGQFNSWFQEMNPVRLTLVFPAAYLNNPASMFGHTMLRVDPQGGSEQTRLFANTINYAADTREQRGVTYAFKGLFGGYQGRFSISPYYVAVKTYGDIENRDIWEYGLNLTPEEIGRMLGHLWEMRSAWFDYYFLDENCSYHLLSLLETARPGLRLTDRFPLWAIPSETVRAVADAGLIGEVRFRPARTTILLERARLMDNSRQELAKGLSQGEVALDSDALQRLAPKERAQVVELALDYTAYRQSPRFGGAEQKSDRTAELLTARSRMEAPNQTPAIPAPVIWPGAGHKSARAGIGYGYEDQQHFIEFAASPAYHDILDPEGGFTRGARVSLLRGAVRYYPEKERAELERFDLVDIMSTSSWDRFLHPVSWKADIGVARKHPAVSDSLLLGRFNGGIGISHDVSPQTSAHAFAEGTVEVSDRFDYIVAPGVGPSIGVVHDFSGRWRTEVSFLWQFFFLREQRNDYEAVVGNRFTVTRQNIVGLDLAWKREFGNSFPGVKVYWQYYF